MSIKITTTASGSLTPPTAPPSETVKNVDFLIGPNPAGGITGDGEDEETSWTFNFTSDPSFPFFSPSRPLTSALLTLTLTPKNGLVTTDGVLIEGLGIIGGSTPNAPEIQGLPVNITNTIQIQLLNRLPAYTSAAIMGVFNTAGGQIPMRYGDDATISAAKLELVQESPAFQYAAKFVCGRSNGEVVSPGVYFTAVNVHNPTYETIGFRKKIAVALPREKPGPVSKFFDAKLGPDQALEIDNKDIFEHAGTGDDFLKGFVVIESDVELDVVTVYTAGSKEQVETLHTERVPPRRLERGLPDLIPVPDATGSFCRRRESNLTVTVKNQGAGAAGPSVTEVDFLALGKVSVPTPPLGPGASVDLLFPIPPQCFDPDCEFRITVDANNQVTESNEGNNSASGTCLG